MRLSKALLRCRMAWVDADFDLCIEFLQKILKKKPDRTDAKELLESCLCYTDNDMSEGRWTRLVQATKEPDVSPLAHVNVLLMLLDEQEEIQAAKAAAEERRIFRRTLRKLNLDGPKKLQLEVSLEVISSFVKKVHFRKEKEPFVLLLAAICFIIKERCGGLSEEESRQDAQLPTALDRALFCVELVLQLSHTSAALALFSRGSIYLHRGDWDAARRNFDEVISATSNEETGSRSFWKAHLGRAAAMYGIGDIRGALGNLSIAIELCSSTVIGRVARGLMRQRIGEYSLAVEDFTVCIEERPSVHYMRSLRGTVYEMMGQSSLAVQDFNESVRLDPTDAKTRSRRGHSFAIMGQAWKAQEDAEAALKINPNDSSAYITRGEAFMAEKNFDLALENFSSAIRAEKRNSCTNGYAKRGMVYLKKNMMDEAMKDFGIVLRDGDIVQGEYGRGLVLLTRGEYEAAISCLTRAIDAGEMKHKLPRRREGADDVDMVPQNVELCYFHRGLAYEKLGKQELALIDFDKAISLNPRNPLLFFRRGNSYESMGRKRNAINDYSEALRLRPGHSPSHHNRGRTFFAAGEMRCAVDDYSKALKYDAENEYETYYLRACAYLTLERYEDAILDFSKSIHLLENAESGSFALFSNRVEIPELERVHTNCLVGRGDAYFKIGSFEKAFKDYSRVLNMSPDLLEAWDKRAMTSCELGKLDVAEKDLDDLMKMLKLSEEDMVDEETGKVLSASEQKTHLLLGAKVLLHKGRIAEKTENYSKAMQNFDSCISLLENSHLVDDPKSHILISAISRRGMVYSAMGLHLKATAEFRSVIRRNPEDASAYYNLGIVWQSSGEYAASLVQFNLAMQNCHEQETYANICHSRALSFYCLGSLKEAVDDMKEVVRIRDSPDVYFNYGIMLRDTEDFLGAVAAFSRILELVADVDALNERGVTYMRMGRYEEAISDFSEAIRLDPTRLELFENRKTAAVEAVQHFS